MNWKDAPVQGDKSCSEVRKCSAILRTWKVVSGWNKADWGGLLRMKSMGQAGIWSHKALSTTLRSLHF